MAYQKAPVATRALLEGYFSSYPGEAAIQLNRISPEEIGEYLSFPPRRIGAALLERLDPEVGVAVLKILDDDLFRDFFVILEPESGVRLLARLDPDTAAARMALLPDQMAGEYRDLLTYPPDTAGHIMDPRVATVSMEETAGRVLVRLRHLRDRRITDVCVADGEGFLKALVPLQRIAMAEPGTFVRELVTDESPVSVPAMATREDVGGILRGMKLSSLPVVDAEARLLGIIRYHQILDIAKEEVTEDVQAMFGAGRDERALSPATFAIRHRLPWLQINLATAFLASMVVGLFEDTIARITTLAVFLPVVAGQSGNTGSQALAVTMRGLALREIRLRHWMRVARKELVVGFFNGLAVALVTGIVVYFWTSSPGLGMVIGCAMVVSMVIAGFSGAVIPIILKAFGQDPAQSSSIILTTVTDIVGFMSFLGLATLLASAFHLG